MFTCTQTFQQTIATKYTNRIENIIKDTEEIYLLKRNFTFKGSCLNSLSKLRYEWKTLMFANKRNKLLY